MSLKADKFNDAITLDDTTTLRSEISNSSPFAFDPVKVKPLEVRRNQRRMKNSVQKARAYVFDVLYGTGAHLKALIFLNHYKIPKKFYSDGESSNEEESTTSGSDMNDEITSSSDDLYSSNFSIPFTENRTFINGEIQRVNMELASDDNNNDSMIDILVITAEDEDLPLPSPL